MVVFSIQGKRSNDMGYNITTIKNLPLDLSCYFFLIGDYRNRNRINDLFREDFRVIADRIGENAALIEQTSNSRVEEELLSAMHAYMFSCSKTASFLKKYFMAYPGLLITKQHPNKLKDKSLLVFIPFSILEEVYASTNDLLSDLVSFAKLGDKSIIKKTAKKHKLIKRVSLSLTLGVISLNFDI